jgi:hypothetical protein
MTWPELDPRDEWLLNELKAAYAECMDVPEGATEAAEAAFTWRRIDEELDTLALSFDSAVDEVALVRAPASVGWRSLSFDNQDFGVELEVQAERLIGQLLPPQSGDVELLAPAGVVARSTADATGCFMVDRPPRGPLRLRFTVGSSTLVTDWVIL